MKHLLMLVILAACSSTGPRQLSEKAKEIEVVTLKPVGCHVVGKVVGSHEEGSKEMALNDALNKAADLEATTLFVDQEVPNGRIMSVYSTAYHCE